MEAIKIKRGRPASVKTIRAFVVENLEKMDTYEMAKILNVKPIRIAACIAFLKRAGIISENLKLTGKEIITKAEKTAKLRKVKSPTAEKKNPNWAKREKKEIARRITFDAIIKTAIMGVILTLPAGEAYLEKMLYKASKKFKFHACEFTLKVYFQLLETIKDEKFIMSVYQGKISDLIYRAKKNDYAHLVLDYCGQFKTFKEEITYALNYDIVNVGGIVSMTFCKRDGSSVADVVKFTKKFANYKLVTTHEYCEEKTEDHPKGSAMMLVVIKRVR